jgi:hypothetical protein
MSGKDKNHDLEGSHKKSDRKPGVSRRELLKTAAIGMPVVLTLHSGAALARSSNLIGLAPPGTRDLDGNALCLDTNSVKLVADGTQFDAGAPAEAKVNILSDRVYYPEKNKSGMMESADAVCHKGGTHYYHDRGWHEINLPANGGIVSAAAMVSVSLRGNILFNRIA